MSSATQNPAPWEMSVPNQVPALMRAIEALAQFLERSGVDAQALYLTQLAVEEMGTNIVKYGYDDDREHVIRLRVECTDAAVQIELEDDGHKFDPCSSPEPNPNLSLEERTPGGWGISLVRRLLTRMDYERQGDRNLLRLEVPRLRSDAES